MSEIIGGGFNECGVKTEVKQLLSVGLNTHKYLQKYLRKAEGNASTKEKSKIIELLATKDYLDYFNLNQLVAGQAQLQLWVQFKQKHIIIIIF